MVLISRMEKCRGSQKKLHCDFLDLENAYDTVLREDGWYYCRRKSGVAEVCMTGAGYV